MERPNTYYGFLDSIAGNTEAIALEKQRLDGAIAGISDRIRKGLTPTTVPGLLCHLALKEIARISTPNRIAVSDFAGQARYLRALCAAIPFDSVEPTEDPKATDILEHCDRLWSAMFHREMIEELISTTGIDRRRRAIAAMTSLLSAFQNELSYIEDVEHRVARIFSPFSAEIIEPALGISTADIIRGFDAVRRAIASRIEESASSIQWAEALLEESRERLGGGATHEEFDRLTHAHPQHEEITNNLLAGVRGLHRILLFSPDDLSKELDARAAPFLDAFAFIPGEANRDFRSPYDDDIVRRRPFAKISVANFVLLDVVYSSYSPAYRLLECFDTDRKMQRLNKKRDETLEEEAHDLFTSVVKPDAVFQNYYIRVGKHGHRAERDLLLVKGNCVVVVESKARPLRPVKQRRDKLTRIATDVKCSIQQAYDQACDVIRHIREADGRISVFELNRPQPAELDVSSINHFFPVVFLDSYYGLVATDLGPWLKQDEAIGFPWVVDRDTFASISLKVDSFEKLRRFLEWRRTLHGKAINEDEAVFAGAFLTHGPFEMPKNAALVQLNPDYADIFEAEYFRRKGFAMEKPPENVGRPVFSSMERVGGEILFKTNGKLDDVINIKSGEHYKPPSRKKSRELCGKVGRNDPCPCGSGKKFKKCCMPPG
jgi:hypothetical protein